MTTPLRIAITVPHFSLDIGRNESGLGQGLAKLGHEAAVFATDVGGKRGAAARAAASANAYPYQIEVVASVPFTKMNPIPIGMSGQLGEFAPDVVHSSEDTDMLTVMTFKATRRLGLPFILSTERYYVPQFPKSAGYRVIEKAWTKRIRREADAVTTHSTIQKEFWSQRGLRRPDVEMIPVGVWTDTFSPGKSDTLRERFKIDPDCLVGLTVGRMTPYKDYPTMMRAMRAALDAHARVHLVVVGFGRHRERVVRLARELGLESIVHFVDEPVPHARMPDLMRAADFYLQTSSVEPFGISVVEAMAVGKAVIVTDVGGMRDTVTDSVVGQKAPAGDSRAIAGCILKLQDAAFRERLGSAARANAVERFDWLVVCRAYLQAYARGIEASAAAGRTRVALGGRHGARA